ncbi:transglutaminase-like domain-containing protein [Acutalibacter caecimuris]|uniref:transglutaminase-like domain-containing protein n=1 Tax=Acutalibacter caecimuris TaxID=3093657 RepID=UPI002AC8BA33|nr:transglutaminase-like domain-containing protein [Acutalibacter sp. M00118]
MSIFTDALQAFAQAAWQGRQALVDSRLPAYRQAWQDLTGDVRVAFEYIAGTLPLTDLGDYPPALFVETARQALAAREAFPWCRALPEHLFLREVACPRVNTEELSPCREPFRRALAPLLQGLCLADAVQAVNRWCAGQVCYRSTDGRTASALDIYRRGWGRCGEESVFAVNALRSVGIAARQVYAPRWSHCDDNHAWVEVFDGTGWRYLGACEPEPRLDMGWFTPAAGRAMLCHVKAFVGDGEGWQALFPGVGSLDLDRREGVAYESVTARYAPVQPFTVTVQGAGGPVCGAKVTLHILNEGGLCPIAGRVTDSRGQAALNLGLGSLWVTAQKGPLLAEALVNTAETHTLKLALSEGQAPTGQAGPVEFDFFAPQAGSAQNPPLSPAEKQERRQVLAQAKAGREARPVPAPQVAPAHRPFAAMLTEKDRAVPLAPAVLEESLLAAGQAPAGSGPALLSPRVGLEPLAPWRTLLQGALPTAPPQLWAWLSRETAPTGSFGELPQTPAGAWRLGRASGLGLPVLFCALCRANGVPARLGPDGHPVYQAGGRFCRADGQGTGEVTLQTDSPGGWQLMRFADGWQPLAVEPGQPAPLPPGHYRLMAAVRLPNGNQLGWYKDFTLAAGEKRALTPTFRPTEGYPVLQDLSLPETGFAWKGPALLCWLAPGEEPTEHILGELKAAWPRLEALGCGLYLAAKEPEKLSFAPPHAHLCPWDEDVAENMARRTYQEPGVLPLAVLAGPQASGRFACAGYRVGLGDLLSSLAALL